MVYNLGCEQFIWKPDPCAGKAGGIVRTCSYYLVTSGLLCSISVVFEILVKFGIFIHYFQFLAFQNRKNFVKGVRRK